MKTEITPEALQALLQSSEMLKAVCERAARCEAAETALTEGKTPLHEVFREARQRLGPYLPSWEGHDILSLVHQAAERIGFLTAQRDQEVHNRTAWETAAGVWRERYDKEVAKNGDLVNTLEKAQQSNRNLFAAIENLQGIIARLDDRLIFLTEQRNTLVRDRDAIAEQRDRALHNRTAWEDTANQNQENTGYYRSLLDQVAVHLGPDVFIADDGGRHDSPLRAKIPELVARLAQENETLARNVPPEPLAEEWREGDSPQSHPNERAATPASVFDTPSGAAALPVAPADIRGLPDSSPLVISKVIGQQWCRVKDENDVPADAIGNNRHGGGMVLCDVLQDTVTGALTYRPLAVKDLPLVPSTFSGLNLVSTGFRFITVARGG